MGNILTFKSRQKKHDPIAIKLVRAACEIDDVLLKYLKDEQIETQELIGVVAHRLGSLLKHAENKDELWAVCEKILKRQAQLDGQT